MPEDRLGHVGLTVSNLDEMLAFFTGMLGFAVKARLQPFDPHAVAGITGVEGAVVREIAYVARGELTFELLEYLEPKPILSPLRPCDPGYMHWLLEVNDLPAAVERAARHGFAPVRGPYPIAAGPNAGRLGTYLRHRDGFSLEVIGAGGR
ncbi:MAG: VOC family protein [Steroidobacteraceae bacterium]|jgi:catechol 2,3-dioxygenase-like lactoylglutathione lyase family enzyme|nr:VOC family protein [Steroidobacteraceae bacterium]